MQVTKIKKQINFRKEGGFIAFTSLLVISAVSLSIALTVALFGIGDIRSSLDQKKGEEALKTAQGCVEEALLRLRDDVNYTGGNLTLGDGQCTISVGGSGANRTIDVSATTLLPSSYTRKLQVTVVRKGTSIDLVTYSQIP